jgi:hypothetical protein
LRNNVRLAAGAGVLASENVVFVPLTVPAGVSASTKAAVELTLLNEFTVLLKPFTSFVKLETFVERPPTLVVTEPMELVLPATVVVRLLRFVVRPAIDMP